MFFWHFNVHRCSKRFINMKYLSYWYIIYLNFMFQHYFVFFGRYVVSWLTIIILFTKYPFIHINIDREPKYKIDKHFMLDTKHVFSKLCNLCFNLAPTLWRCLVLKLCVFFFLCGRRNYGHEFTGYFIIWLLWDKCQLIRQFIWLLRSESERLCWWLSFHSKKPQKMKKTDHKQYSLRNYVFT